MPADKIHVYPGKTKGAKKKVYIIHCPVCRFDFERPLKRKAVEFANVHKIDHPGIGIEVTK